jgi:hypothetical protein
LYHLVEDNTKLLAVWMGALETMGRLTIEGQKFKNVHTDCRLAWVYTAATLGITQHHYGQDSSILCHHI